MRFKDLEWKDVVSDGTVVCSHCEISEKKIHLELEMDFEKNLLDD